MKTVAVEISEVHKSFATRNGMMPVLAGVNLVAEQGSFTCLFGPNGCGKSTLLSIVAGLEQADSGRVEVDHRGQRRLPMVFQDVRRSLLPWMNAERNITFPLRIAGFSSAQVRDKLERVIEFVGAPFDLKARVFSLSGGEAQLVCLLRALIIEPRILLCDEPLSALDYQASIVLQDRLLSAAGRLGLTVIYVCHDLDEALYLGDRVVFLSARPARVMHVLETGLGRPRSLAIQATPEFALLKGRALRLFAECTGNRFNGASGSDLKSP